MPTRHLSDEQRQRYASFAADPSPEELARYFHLDRTDREVTDGLRGDHNRFGFALMLGSARFLGIFPGVDLAIPGSVTAFLVGQLGLKAAPCLKGYFDHKNGQRIRHLALIRKHYGFTEFADNGPARFRLTRWLYALCWSGDDHPGPLVERATSWLVVNKVMLPGVSVLERFVGRIRDRAQKRLWKRLVAALDEKQHERIAKLFDEDSETRFAALDGLRTVPTQRSPSEFLLHLDRLEAIRAFDLRPSPPKGVPAASLERLARIARAGKPSAIAALQEPRRTATVAALFHTLETAAQDDAAELAEALITDLVKDAEAADKRARLRSLRDLDDAALLLRDMAKLVFEEDALPLDQWREVLFERLPHDDLVAAMAEIDAIARPRDAKPYAELLTRWRRARRLFFKIATRLEMDAAPGGKAVQEAIRYLATIADWSSAKMRDAPTTAIPKAWQRHVLDAEGRVADPKAYVFATIDAWRAALKRRDIFARPGTRYGDPRRGLLDGATWQSSKLMVCRALNRSLNAETEITALSQLLDGAYRTVADRAASNPDLRFETANGKARIVVTPLDRLEETESLRTLRPAIQRRMPKAGMPDLFLEIMQRTGFAKAFTHLSERQARVEHFETSLCAALIAEACNIGIEPVSRQDVPALRRERLTWVSQNFIRRETIAAANARIVSAHATLPLVKLWGAGDVASADGMRFTAPASAIHAGPNPKYFGQARGVTWYNLLSNQFSGLSDIVVPGTLRDSLVLLALLLEQETELEPMEFMTDTAAYSDAVFGLFYLLGYQFSPRLADLGDARLWRIDRKADYGRFNSLSKGTINLALIRQTEGLIGSIIGLLGLALAVPDHSTLSRRAETLEVPRPSSGGGAGREPMHLLVDSTGLKLCGAGEWLVEKHGTKARRSWRKLHIGVDADTGEIVATALTTNDVDDASQIGRLLDQVEAPVASFTGDGAYDQDSVYRTVTERDPEAAVVVPPRATAVPSETAETEPTQRDRHLQCIAEKGRIGWQKVSGYTKRSRVETAIGRYKQVVGEGLRFRKDRRRTTEVAVAVHALNRMLELGRPISVRIK